MGVIFYVDCGSLRTDEYPNQQQHPIFQMGANLQGRYDDRRGDRSASPSQHNHLAQRGELSPGGRSSQTESPGGLAFTNTTSHRAIIHAKAGREIQLSLKWKYRCRRASKQNDNSCAASP
jgi:hypothetical protein